MFARWRKEYGWVKSLRRYQQLVLHTAHMADPNPTLYIPGVGTLTTNKESKEASHG